MAKIASIHAILSLKANFSWQLSQLDTKKAFLHGDLQQVVYMDLPLGFVINGKKYKVCHLKRSLHGPKKSPWALFDRFSKAVIHPADHTMFVKGNNVKVVILAVSVDETVFTGNDDDEITKLKCLPQTVWNQRLWTTKVFSWIEVARSKNGIVISQQRNTLLTFLKKHES